MEKHTLYKDPIGTYLNVFLEREFFQKTNLFTHTEPFGKDRKPTLNN